MPVLPNSIALTSIGAGAQILSADHRNNYAAIQTAVNALITALGVTAKGDLLVATASGTIINLGVGTDGQVLAADSTQTKGVKWSTLASGVATYAGNLASASSVTPTAGRYVIHTLTGTTSVNTIAAGTTGDILTLIASGQASGTLVAVNHLGGNVKMKGGRNFGIYAQVPADAGASIGESLTFVYDGSNWVQLSESLRSVLDYVQITSNVSVTATTEGTANTAITGSALTTDGATPLEYEFYCKEVDRGTSDILVYLYEDGSSIGALGEYPGSTGPLFTPMTLKRRRTPTAASHTPSLRAAVNAGTGTIVAGAGGSGAAMPAYLSVKRSV